METRGQVHNLRRRVAALEGLFDLNRDVCLATRTLRQVQSDSLQPPTAVRSEDAVPYEASPGTPGAEAAKAEPPQIGMDALLERWAASDPSRCRKRSQGCGHEVMLDGQWVDVGTGVSVVCQAIILSAALDAATARGWKLRVGYPRLKRQCGLRFENGESPFTREASTLAEAALGALVAALEADHH